MHRNSLHFFYTNNERLAREIKETIIFTITPRRIKYTGINLLKESRDLYFENCRMLMKEIKYNTDRKIGRSAGEGNGNPFQYSCLENPRIEEPSGLLSPEFQRAGHD